MTKLILISVVLLLISLLGCKSHLKVETQSHQASVEIKLPFPNPEWSLAVIKSVEKALPSIEKAQDIEQFCPTWKALNKDQKVNAFSVLVAAVVYRESRYNPKSSYQEPPPPKGPGTLSQGLLQLSTGDHRYGGDCVGITKASLYEPIVNLKCGVHMMGRLIERDVVVASGAGKQSKGMARYWSVIREPSVRKHHKKEIQDKVKAYCS